MTLDIKLEGGAILSGQVTDSDGKPVANANITAYGPKTKQWVQTAADGTYRIALTPGTYTLRIAPPKESGLPLTTIENVQVKEDMTLDIKLEGGTILSGRVTDSDGKPVANASINASGPSHVYTKTATDGTYRMILSPGAYRLEIEPPEESGLLRKSIHDVQVTKDKKLDITLEKGVTLSGKVTASDGKPVARAFINARGAMPERYGHGQTADDGGYRITLTPAYPPFPKGG